MAKSRKVTKKLGRPSKYKKEYCQQLIDHMSQGFSYYSFAGLLGVCRDSLYQWEMDYPAFSYSKKIAFDKCLLHWETVGFQILRGKGSAATWIFNMKARFGYRDQGHTEEQKPEAIQIELVERVKSE